MAVPQWDLVDDASPENPTSGVLVISGSAIAEGIYYSMDGADADLSGQTRSWFEARLCVKRRV